jgi:hypothetical protein
LNEDERRYEFIDRDITAAMLRAADKCTIRKQHDTPWAPSISKATHDIRYWTRRTANNGIRHIDDRVLDHFLEHSDVDASYFDRTLTVKECACELKYAKAKFKDVLDEATSNGDLYEVEVATARVERRYPHLVKDNVMQAQEQEEQIEKEVKQRKTRHATQKSFRKLGYQIRGHVKPKSTKKLSLNRLDVQTEDGFWRQIVGKTQVEEHLIERNVEQFSHTGATPLGYTELGRELGHTGDTPMAEAILDGSFEHESLMDEALAAILQQLRKHPNVQEIIQPIITEADFKSAFKCVPENTASSFSGCGVHHYRACAEGSEDGLAYIQSAIHAAMMTVPLATGFCPERWKKVIDVMLEKTPGVVWSNKLRIIQLLEADLNQVLRKDFARNIAKLAKNNKGIISDHQYGRANATCLTPVLNKLLTVQLLIQKQTEEIIFDNDAKECYDRIISGVALASLRRLGYSKESVKMLGLLWAQMEHHVCTGFGASDSIYGSTTENLLY